MYSHNNTHASNNTDAIMENESCDNVDDDGEDESEDNEFDEILSH